MMKMESRYSHKYNAFLDGLYIIELCDTDDEEEYLEIVEEYGQEAGFVAYIDGKEIK